MRCFLFHVQVSDCPRKSSSLPKGIPYIIGNEAAERFSFYGMRSILFVYMTTYLMQPGGLLDTFTDQEAKVGRTFLWPRRTFPSHGCTAFRCLVG